MLLHMALAKTPTKMQKHQNGTVKASVFLAPAVNRALKMKADEESQKTGERVSISAVAARILEKALGV